MNCIREKVLSMRMNEFGFKKVSFLGSDVDVFPNKIHIVKWVTSEPFEAFSVEKGKYVSVTSYCYVIGSLEWNDHEPCWEFSSCGTRFLIDGTEELMRWIYDFTEKYEVVDGELVETSETIES